MDQRFESLESTVQVSLLLHVSLIYLYSVFYCTV